MIKIKPLYKQKAREAYIIESAWITQLSLFGVIRLTLILSFKNGADSVNFLLLLSYKT